MKLFIARSDVAVAEARLAQAKRDARASIADVRATLYSRLTHPSSLLAVTGIGTLVGVWFARRSKRASPQDGVSAWTPMVGIVSTLLTRLGMQRLADVWMMHSKADTAPGNPPAATPPPTPL